MSNNAAPAVAVALWDPGAFVAEPSILFFTSIPFILGK